ncbi:transglutaminase-like cysteine peptidase [Croceicoccus naphthovorans]|uniref:transglutaminase-like cysteine peptidase n=1 Tax=Croceicoccus naphthovorans TaxID=1348774 RepID=UPI000A7C88E2|nr:transglutaminase-like cysteine peptidase [Croceicoccus naphthovorans]MBB3990563.1 putative transglutaminase-like cysteine proteinase [Croceicoccus naphthovorans]
MPSAPLSPKVRSLAKLAFAAAAFVPVASQAQAPVAGSAIIASAVTNFASSVACKASAPAAPIATSHISRAKPMSALEAMRAKQANPSFTLSAAQTAAIENRPSYMPAIAAQAASASLQPSAYIGITCAKPFVSARPVVKAKRFDFLQSRVVPISKTNFDADWRRVSGAGSGLNTAALSAIDAGEASLEKRIARVNAWVNARVAFTDDAKLYGKTDYWATASETLSRGKGDCEDYAIAKMELLAGLGVPRDDMYLTIARDLVRRADHAVLIVKIEGRSVMLDNASDALLDGDVANDYRPILSFSADKRFLHGF